MVAEDGDGRRYWDADREDRDEGDHEDIRDRLRPVGALAQRSEDQQEHETGGREAADREEPTDLLPLVGIDVPIPDDE